MEKTTLTAVPGQQEIVTSHVFDAPREVVFRVISNPDLIPDWWGPAYLTTEVDRAEIRTGGSWRIVQRDPEGKPYAFHGVYHEVRPPDRMVYTFEYEGEPGKVMLETITLEDLGGRTRMTDAMVFQSVADRDGMLQAGMEEGGQESMDRLAVLVARAAGQAGG